MSHPTRPKPSTNETTSGNVGAFPKPLGTPQHRGSRSVNPDPPQIEYEIPPEYRSLYR